MNEKYPDLFVGVSYHNGDILEIMSPTEFPSDVPGFPYAWLDRVHETDAYHGDDYSGYGFALDDVYEKISALERPAPTVKGDIHDIGKNIVKMLLENYGYHVVDLGRDVAPEAVVEAAQETKAPLVGLSSLMTTTAQNMAVTIRALREAGVKCKVMVGGAVVTEAFARQIGADFYVKDAAQSAKVAAQVLGG